MTYVIAEPCIGEKDNSCVEVCPVDCIHPTPDEPDYENQEQLFIDPDEASNNSEVISVLATDSLWAGAVRAETGACFWLRVRPGQQVVFGTGSDCTGLAARAAEPSAWPSP